MEKWTDSYEQQNDFNESFLFFKLSSKKDNLGRFSVEDSLSFKHQFITK